jgi:hypothetical protein
VNCANLRIFSRTTLEETGMSMTKQIQLFRWMVFLVTSALCIDAIIKYWTPVGSPIVAFNCAIPIFMFFFFRKDTVNRIGIFMLISPFVFIGELSYIILFGLPIPLDTAVNELAILFTANLTLFGMFGDHFTGWMRKNLDRFVYPLLVPNLAAYALVYIKHPFPVLPYLFLIAVLAGATAMAICIEETQKPHGLQIRIRDNGRGVPEDVLSNLFRGKVTSQTGSGVGLLGVRMIVECHGGHIITAATKYAQIRSS